MNANRTSGDEINVQPSRMMADLAELARHTKHAGTVGERESLAVIEARLREAGFSCNVLSHDAYISLPGNASCTVAGQALTCITHSMAAATGPDGICGMLIDLGRGDAAAFAREDLRGRILLVDGIASPVVALRATRAGAAGVIHVSPHEHLHEMCLSPVWGNPSLETVGQLPKVPVVTVSAADGAAVRSDLAREGGVEATIFAEVDTGWRETPLLVAELSSASGSTEEDEPFVLFSGHHDTWHYGVMDNGSANVAIIEVARNLVKLHKSWKRGLRICIWSGHSQGRYSGSAWYVDNHWRELDKRCVAHVNIDSPGGLDFTSLTGTGVMGALRPLAHRVILSQTGQELAGNRKVRSADDSLQSLGVPSMFGSLSRQESSVPGMRNALGWWWHTPHDLIDKINPEFLARDARILFGCLEALLCDEILPISHDETLADLAAQIAGLQQNLEGSLDLAIAATAVETLRNQLQDLTRAGHAQIVNAALMELSRWLVPLDYGNGDRFSHLPALPTVPWPVLEPLRRLAAEQKAASEEADATRFARVDAQRALNRLEYNLAQATASIASLSHFRMGSNEDIETHA